MEGTMGNEGINRLARVMQARMRAMGERPPALDIGEIGGDMSLTTNQFPEQIPRADYLVCRHVEEGGGLKPGDRVLVAWAGDDACVVGAIA